MCGIVGIAGRDDGAEGASALTDRARSMVGRLRHRGPDDDGAWSSGRLRAALGHRRLAVIDTTPASRQPIRSPDGTVALSYNGEVYNYRNLRKQLEDAGDRFRSDGDAEVLAAALARWGVEKACSRVNGMFAFVAVDRERGGLVAARDRLGQKPLYYGRVGEDLVFASELKAIFAHPRFDRRVDRDALRQYLRFDFVPEPRSIVRGVTKLPPGCFLRIRLPFDGERPEPEAYWRAAEAASEARVGSAGFGTDKEAVDALEEVLARAVEDRLVADVPVGGLLSGGIDSSTITALMQEVTRSSVQTFTVGFEEDRYDESRRARRVAGHLGTEHTEVVFSAEDALAAVPRMAETYDEPLAHASQIPTHLIAKTARDSVTVGLSGDGGDEMFWGYNRHVWVPRVWQAFGRLPSPVRSWMARALPMGDPGGWDRWMAGVSRFLPDRFVFSVPHHKAQKLALMLRASDRREAYLSTLTTWPRPEEVVADGEAAAADPWAHGGSWREQGDLRTSMALHDQTHYLPGGILAKVDRASMATSLEVRSPFLDPRVFRLAWRLPARYKVRDGRGKWILRRLLRRHLPAELVEGPKRGFVVPMGEWLRGPLRSWAEGLLSEERIRATGRLRPAPVRATWERHLAGERDRADRLWNVLVFLAWEEEHGFL